MTTVLQSAILASFSADEFQRLMSDVDPTLMNELPGAVGMAPATLVHKGIALLERHDRLDPRFFQLWAALRPKRRDEIEALAARVLRAHGESSRSRSGAKKPPRRTRRRMTALLGVALLACLLTPKSSVGWNPVEQVSCVALTTLGANRAWLPSGAPRGILRAIVGGAASLKLCPR